jgi:hypothetical protein
MDIQSRGKQTVHFIIITRVKHKVENVGAKSQLEYWTRVRTQFSLNINILSMLSLSYPRRSLGLLGLQDMDKLKCFMGLTKIW